MFLHSPLTYSPNILHVNCHSDSDVFRRSNGGYLSTESRWLRPIPHPEYPIRVCVFVSPLMYVWVLDDEKKENKLAETAVEA